MNHSNRRCRGDLGDLLMAIVVIGGIAFVLSMFAAAGCETGKVDAYRAAHALPDDAVIQKWLGSDDWYAIWKDAGGAIHAKWVSKPEAVR